MSEEVQVIIIIVGVIAFLWMLVPFLILGTNGRLDKLNYKLHTIAENQEKILKEMKRRNTEDGE